MSDVHPVSLEDAISTFQDEINGSYWEEHGITDEEAGKALRKVFTAFGVPFNDDALFLHGQLSNAAEIDRNRRAEEKYTAERAQWRLDHPEEAAQEDRIYKLLNDSRDAMIDAIMGDLLKPNPLFSKIIESPNTASFTEDKEQ